jgi:carboxymethylenebutenolidase
VLASTIGWGRPVDQANATRQWLAAEAGLGNDQIRLIRFCLGGGFALAVGRGWGAVSSNYGTVPPTTVMRGIGPVIACYGGRDRAFARMAPRLRKSLDVLGADGEVHVFPEVGHSFLTDGDHPVAAAMTRSVLRVDYQHHVAEDAWQRIIGFFDRHLSRADGAAAVG